MNSRRKISAGWILLATGLVIGFTVYFYTQRLGTQWITGMDRQAARRDHSMAIRNAPSFQLPDAQGQLHKLEDFRGKAIILHFWASWCPPCLDEIPQWVELGTDYRDKSLQLIAISLDSSWADAQRVLPSQRLSANVVSLLDASGLLPESYGTFQFPETYLLSPDLKIVTKLVGPQDWQSAGIRRIIEQVISQRSPKSIEANDGQMLETFFDQFRNGESLFLFFKSFWRTA